jgi:hypothetical protein
VSSRSKRQGTAGRHRARSVRPEAPKPRFGPSHFGLPNDSTATVKSALDIALIENINAMTATLEEALALARPSAAPADRADAIRMVRDSLPIVRSANELSDWVSLPRRPMAFDEALRKAQTLAGPSPNSDEVELWLRSLRTRSVGAPARRRESFISAFEFMLQSKGNSQGVATRKFCECGRQNHDVNCERNLKAGIRSLKKVLRKHAPELLTRYDSLHPDRAKKADG